MKLLPAVLVTPAFLLLLATAVRYAGENWPTCNLYNGAGLPAAPLRTDSAK